MSEIQEDTTNKKWKREQQFTQTAYDPVDTDHRGAIHMPIYQNSLFAFERYDQFEDAMKQFLSSSVYSRGNNPTVHYLEEKLAVLEQAESAKCFASGMAAISSAIFSVIGTGDHVVCVNQAYGPTREFLGTYLKRFHVETTFVDGSSMEAWQHAIRPNTKLLYLESPTSMLFQLQDLQKCAELARSIGAVTIIDNTWATPCFQNPLQFGIDLVVHSITKYISGHSDALGGVVLGSKEMVGRIGQMEYMLLGGIMTPQTAALVSKGLRTLPLRMQRHEESGLLVAKHMGTQSYVTLLNHPGISTHPQYELGLRQMTGTSSLFSFLSYEPIAKLKEWASLLKYFKIGVSWGGFESLITVNRVEGEFADQAPSVVRLYVGLENPEDLIADLDQAWEQVQLFKPSIEAEGLTS